MLKPCLFIMGKYNKEPRRREIKHFFSIDSGCRCSYRMGYRSRDPEFKTVDRYCYFRCRRNHVSIYLQESLTFTIDECISLRLLKV